jgi:hypothetical protein
LLHELNLACALARGGAQPGDDQRPRLEEAENLSGHSYRTSLRVLGPEHPITLAGMTEWGRSLRLLQRDDEALKCLEVCVPLCERVLGPEHGDTAWAMQQLEVVLRRAGRNDEANRLVPRYCTAWMKTYGPSNYINRFFLLYRIHALAFINGRPDDAAQFALERLAELRNRDGVPPDSTIVGILLLVLADARLAQNIPAEAELPLREATPILEKNMPTLGFHWMVHRELGAAYLQQKRFVDAESEFLLANRGLASRKAWNFGAHQECRQILSALVNLYTAWDQPEKAGEWRRKLEAFDRIEAASRTAPPIF